jgi:hypothetical protein
VLLGGEAVEARGISTGSHLIRILQLCRHQQVLYSLNQVIANLVDISSEKIDPIHVAASIIKKRMVNVKSQVRRE